MAAKLVNIFIHKSSQSLSKSIHLIHFRSLSSSPPSNSSFANRRHCLLFLGAPGVGKGTFGKRIAPHFNAQLMTSSDLLRAAADEQMKSNDQSCKENGEYIKNSMKTGKLVSDDIVIPIVIDFLRNVSNSFIFDGFPRTLKQAERLQQEYPLDLGIYFKLPHHILVNKMLGRRVCTNRACGASFNICEVNEGLSMLCDNVCMFVSELLGEIVMPSMKPKKDGICDKCGSDLEIRVDDTLEIIEERMRIFYQQSKPIIEYYRSEGLLLEYEIKKGVDDVDDILEKIQKRLKKDD